MTTPFSFFHRKITISDTGKPLTTDPLKLWNMDMQVQSNPIDIGDNNDQDLQLSVGDIYGNPTNQPVILSDIWAVNHTTGSTGYLVVTGFIADDNKGRY